MKHMASDFLRRLPLFAGLPEADFEALWRQIRPLTLRGGEWLMREGERADSAYVVLEGEVEITKQSGERQVFVALCGPGEIIGEMALLEQAPRSASGRAQSDSQLLVIGEHAFKQVLRASPTAALSLLSKVMARLRSNEALLRQSEKMATLGTLAAGLAHELNNPAAAVHRGSALLGSTLLTWQRLTSELSALQWDANQAAALRALQAASPVRAASPATQPDALARADAERALQEWLEAAGIGQAWELAPALAASGYDAPMVETLTRPFAKTQMPLVVRWLAAGCSTHALLDEVHTSARRMSEIVKAVKAYTWLDQAPLQQMDVREGIENTLTILRHKINPGVSITRDYAPDLPRVEAYASEPNQVWTNLIDNALDAMDGHGILTLRAAVEDGAFVLEITDSGPGIPPEIQARIFDPFFTTKAPGSGTGLGLHIANNIIQRHHGKMEVVSKPGATTFRVTLPTRTGRS